MDLRKLARYSQRLEHIMNGTLEWEMDHGIEDLVENEDWELMSILAMTAKEIPARRIVDQLLDNEQYFPCVLPACFRRQLTQPRVINSGSLRSRVFRDIDAIDEEEEGGIPDHIREMAEEISEVAESTRRTALHRELQEDDDAIRTHIVEALGGEMNLSAEAVNALVLISICSVFEDTRRTAAMKIANHRSTVTRMAEAGRSKELVQISKSSGMDSVARNIAEALTDQFEDIKAEGNNQILRFMAEYHPDREIRNSAGEELPEGWDEQ